MHMYMDVWVSHIWYCLLVSVSNNVSMLMQYICHGDAGRFQLAHRGHVLSPKHSFSLNNSGPYFSDIGFDEHKVVSHLASEQAP